MKSKKLIIFNSIAIFSLMFLTHFVYTLLPSTFTAIFFPVNESIWEHMKMIYTTIIFYSLVEYYIFIRFKYSLNNFLFNTFIKAISVIMIFLTIFLPIYYNFQTGMPIILTVLFISLLLGEVISYLLNKYILKTISNVLSISLIVIIFILFAYLTYNPIKTHLFLDTEEEKYGINNYNI